MQSSKNNKLNTLHLIQGLEVGGLEIMVINLLSKLNHDKYPPSICCFDTLGILSEGLEKKGIKVHLLNRKPGVDLLYPLKLSRLLKNQNIKILHLHNPTALFYGALAGVFAGIQCIVYTEHGRDFSSSWKVRLTNRFLCMLIDRVVVVAEGGKRYLVHTDGVNRDSIDKIYNGIDPSLFDETGSSDEKISGLDLIDDQPVIGIVARLDPIKNHKCLIQAMAKVTLKFPTAVLLIVGQGEIKKDLESLIRTLGLESNIKLLGERSDIPQLLKIMDLFVLSSYSEGLSLTLIEASAAGKPIIATDVGGNSEIVEHGETGLIVPSDNPDEMALAIMDLLADRKKSRQMGIAARKKFEKNFTLNEMVKKYEQLYRTCLNSEFPLYRKLFSVLNG